MNPRRVYAIFLRQLFLLRHNGTRFVNIFLWMILDIILWGFITRYLDTVGNSGFSFVPILLGAVILWDFLLRIQQGVMVAFLEDVWTQNFLNIFASPITITEYVSGLVLTSVTTSIVAFIVMLILAGIFFGYTIFTLGAHLLLFVLILFIFGLTLGILTAGVVLRFGPSAEWFAWPIPLLLSPLAGVYYPISTLPKFLQPVSRLIPPSYAFEGMRSVLLSGSISFFPLLAGIALAVFYLILSCLFFVSIYRTLLRNGLITRFSAESL